MGNYLVVFVLITMTTEEKNMRDRSRMEKKMVFVSIGMKTGKKKLKDTTEMEH